MPGVPSGRGCDACRKQKKKCDQAKPSCSRCTRLGSPCIGAGLQRFKFQQEPGTRAKGSSSPDEPPTAASTHALTIAVGRSRSITRSPDTIPSPPSNQLTVLRNGFINAIAPSTDLRFNLALSFGGWLAEIPARIGVNKALDAAVAAITDAHSEKCRYQRPTASSLAKYSNGLSALRVSLDETSEATSSETLAAVLMLMNCQYLLGIGNSHYTGHGEGAAKILKLRGRYYDPHDQFEMSLIQALRGPVVFEACYNPRIRFTQSEWKDLVESPLDASRPGGGMMKCMANVPPFTERAKAILSGAPNALVDLTLFSEITSNYEIIKLVISGITSHMLDIQTAQKSDAWARLSGSYLDPVSQTFTAYQLVYGLGLVIGIVHELMLNALSHHLSIPFQSESEDLVQQILSIRENIAQYKPIGSNSLGLFLHVARSGTKDEAVKKEIDDIIREAEEEGVITRMPADKGEKRDDIERHLKLFDPEVYG